MAVDEGINISSMKITLGDKIIAWLTLLSGLTISAVAIWYSVAGLVSIFAAAVIPIIVMGVVLEVSKLIATVWLKINWNRAPVYIRTYLAMAIVILMVITSMGIFGFLSKAHSDQSLVSGEVQSKIAIYDEKIKTARENIEANRKQLKQMDEAVDQVMGRSSDEKGADKAVSIRKAQSRDRSALAKDIEANQKLIAKLNDEAAPIRAEVRKVEAEVGPIKYIAKLIYGDNPDTNILEKAVTWVIIMIVVVFDPLAVVMLLAAQMTFGWRKEEKEVRLVHNTVPAYEPDNGPLTTEQLEQIKESGIRDPHTPGWMYTNKVKPYPSTEEEVEELQQELAISKHAYLNKPFVHFENLKPMVATPDVVLETDFPKIEQNEAAEEAAKWAQEQLEDSKKKSKYIIKSQNQQIKKTKE